MVEQWRPIRITLQKKEHRRRGGTYIDRFYSIEEKRALGCFTQVECVETLNW